jgi:hypothetical protein
MTLQECVCGRKLHRVSGSPSCIGGGSRELVHCPACGRFYGGFRRTVRLATVALELGLESVEYAPREFRGLRYARKDAHVDLFEDGSFAGQLQPADMDVVDVVEDLVAAIDNCDREGRKASN